MSPPPSEDVIDEVKEYGSSTGAKMKKAKKKKKKKKSKRSEDPPKAQQSLDIATHPPADSALPVKTDRKTLEKLPSATVQDSAIVVVPATKPDKTKKRSMDPVAPHRRPKQARSDGNGSFASKRNENTAPSPATTTKKDTSNATPRYSFQVDETDHCETPLKAYEDVAHVLDRLCKSLGKTRSALTIYDPYYCNGGVQKKLASLGFTHVINRNRDFYEDISNDHIPDYDVLLTNPPYSGVHMEKLLTYVRQQSQHHKDNNNKAFLLLLPHFVYTKDYYERALQPTSSTATSVLKPFFLVPEARYSYIPPSWVTTANGSKALEKGKDKTAPFPSFWYCHAATNSILPSSWLTQTFGASGMVRPKHASKLRFANCAKDIPRDFKGEFDTTRKRPNPKARKRAAAAAAKKRREGL
jgi:hypothetical protein